MLSLETTDGWTLASVAVTIGAATETYTHTNGSASAYHLAKDFVAWGDDAGRSWHGAVSFDWSWSKGANGGAIVSIMCMGHSATFVPNTTWQALMMHSTATVADSSPWSGSNGAIGTSAPQRSVNNASWSVKNTIQFSGDSGDSSASQAVRRFVPGLAGKTPAVHAIGDVIDAARLTSIAAGASNPRRMAVYSSRRSQWLEFAAGQFVVSSFAPKLFRLTANCAGDVL